MLIRLSKPSCLIKHQLFSMQSLPLKVFMVHGLLTLTNPSIHLCYVGSTSHLLHAFPFVLRPSFMIPFILRLPHLCITFRYLFHITYLVSGCVELDHHTELSTWPDYIPPFLLFYVPTISVHLRWFPSLIVYLHILCYVVLIVGMPNATTSRSHYTRLSRVSMCLDYFGSSLVCSIVIYNSYCLYCSSTSSYLWNA